jgi:uncharacterized phage protein gp47/JayE
MVFDLKQYRDIYEDCKAWIIAHQDRITDFSEGSVISSEIEAFARELALLYSEARSGFSEVLTKLPYSIFNLEKNSAQYAIGQETFSRVDTTVAVTVAVGTQIATAGGVVYETTQEGVIAIGATSITLPIKALEKGKTGNVPAGTITILVSGITGVDAVVNSANVGGGVDEETEVEYYSRFRAYLLGLARSNKYGIISGALLNESLRSASIVEHFPPKSGFYNFTLYLDDGSGTVSNTTIAQVKQVIDGDGTAQFEGYRAVGINVDYLAPTSVPINVTGTVVASYAIDLTEAKKIIDAAITAHLNGKIIGSDVRRADIQRVVLSYPWIIDLNIETPVENITINDGQIARSGTINLVYEQRTED